MKETLDSLTVRQVIFPTLISQEDNKILSQNVSEKFPCAEKGCTLDYCNVKFMAIMVANEHELKGSSFEK